MTLEVLRTQIHVCRVCSHGAQSPLGEAKSNMMGVIKEAVSGYCRRGSHRAGAKGWVRK